MTDDERKLIEDISKIYNNFADLPKQHPTDIDYFSEIDEEDLNFAKELIKKIEEENIDV